MRDFCCCCCCCFGCKTVGVKYNWIKSKFCVPILEKRLLIRDLVQNAAFADIAFAQAARKPEEEEQEDATLEDSFSPEKESIKWLDLALSNIK